MRVLMEYFVMSGKLKSRTLLHNLKSVSWVKPFLGLKRDQLEKDFKRFEFSEERLALFLNPIDPNGIKGLILLDQGIGIFDADLLGDPDTTKEMSGERTIEEIWVERAKRPIINNKSLVSLRQSIDWQIKKADVKFEEAKKNQDELRNLLNKDSNPQDIELISEQLLYLLKNANKQMGDSININESVYGAFTSKGPRYLTYPLPSCVSRWVILKGVAETAISKLIFEVKDWAESEGLPLQVDQCPLYKSEIDRLLLPTLGVGIIDGNRHHPFEPLTPYDIVMDLDSKLLNQEKIYYYAPEIRELQASYKQKMRQGTLELQEAAKDFWAFNQLYEPLDIEPLLTS
jgi:hypothetical protein